MFERIDKEQFESQLNTSFKIVLEDAEPLELSLALVNRIASTPKNEQFSIEFIGPPDRMLAQGTYHLHHPEMGELDIFMTAVRRDDTGFVYEAVFNYLNE